MLLQTRSTGQMQVVILQDGKILQTIDLAEVKDNYSFTVHYQDSSNTIAVTPDTVWVSDATCSNQICVEHGPLKQGGSPITCLPNHLIIRWVNSDVDG